MAIDLGMGIRRIGDVVTRREHWQVEAAVVALVVLVATPYAVMGPNFLLDDFRWLEGRRFVGPFDLMGGQRYHRPGQWVTYSMTFGVIGPHPAVLYGIQTALIAGVGLSILATLRRFIRPELAVAVAVVWVLQPNHTGLHQHSTAANILIAFMFVLAGVRLLADDPTGLRAQVVAAGTFGVGALFYEAVIPAGMAAGVLVPVLMGAKLQLRSAVLTSLAVVPMGVNVLQHPMYPLDQEFMDYGRVLPLHFGQGISGPLGSFTIALVVAGVAWVLWRDRRSESGVLIMAGLVVMAVGVAPYIKFWYRVIGHGDRASFISGVGSAMVLVGLGLYVGRRRQGNCAGSSCGGAARRGADPCGAVGELSGRCVRRSGDDGVHGRVVARAG